MAKILGNGFKRGKEYNFKKTKKGLYKIVDVENNKTVHKTYSYTAMLNHFNSIL